MNASQRRAALVLEFDRLKRRQDELERVLSGEPDAWIRIVERMPDSVGEVTVDKAVAEARQGALAMASIVKTLDGGTKEEAPAAPVEDPADALRKKREEKARQARTRVPPEMKPATEKIRP